jgi:AcrR family transcriptional regulator
MPRDRDVQPSVPPPPHGMAELVKRQPRLLGRPVSGDGEETRQHILRGARKCFATYGYAATGNRLIAAETGVSPAAIYHHFGRKKDLMVAVYEATLTENYALMQAAVEKATSLVDRLQNILDVVHRSLADDPAQATFMFVARDEARRHEELAELADDRLFAALFAQIFDQAVTDGELLPDDAIHLRGALQAITFGLARLGNDTSTATHKLATEGCKLLIVASLDTAARNPS